MTIPGKAVLSFSVLETIPALFHTASALSAPSGHLPLEGKAMVRGGGILVSLPSPWGEKNLELLPPSSGRRCPEGAEVGSRSGMKGNVP